MKKDLLKLQELIEKIVVNFDLDKLNLNDIRGYKLEISSDYYNYDYFGKKGKIRNSIDTIITIQKDNYKIEMPLQEFIKNLEVNNGTKR